MKKFVILLNSETPEQVNAFRDYLKIAPAGWWHWLPNSWLITSSADTLTPEVLRDKVVEIFPGAHNMVIEIRGEDEWHGFGPTQGTYFEWMKETWK